jgi:predicted ATPase/class 3 adenylate cyclase
VAAPAELPSGTVTFLFTDIEGSTRLLHKLGAEAYAQKLAEHRRVVREACSARGGVEVDTQGDAFFVAFPAAREAVAAAQAITEELASGPITLRIGLHTGTPLVTKEGYVGEDIHFAARVAASSHGGQVVLSEATRALLDERIALIELGEHRLKDIADPVAIFQLGDARFPPLKTISNTNLPRPASSFVGREREIEEVITHIQVGARLVSLTGPGGSGKTRLALEAAATLIPEYKAGVFWIGLASLRDPALVTEAIAHSLGAKDSLHDHIGERQMLLLLDNLEQVIEAAPELVGLLRSCPNLTLLVTSRELLRVEGEVEYPVAPLAEPEAVSLFCARAQLDPSEEISELCSRLDSLPLAVELAAARTKTLTPNQILERLSQRLDLLKGGRDAESRHATLRSTIAWSYELLNDEEQGLFARLTVFSGGCTLEAAEEVADADLGTLASLVEKSLMRRTGERFWMLETIREFASERLEAGDEAQAMQRRHAGYFLELVEALEPSFLGPEEGHALEQLNVEHDNFRAALRFTLDTSDVESALRLSTGGLQRFWRIKGHQSEGRRWLEEALVRHASDPSLRAQGLRALSNIAAQQGDRATAGAAAEEALSIFRESGDVASAVDCLNSLGVAGIMSGDLGKARRCLEEAEQLARASDDTFRLSVIVSNLGNIHLYEGAYEAAQGLFEESVDLARELELDEGVASSLVNVALAALHLAQYDRASALLRESLALSHRIGDVVGIVYAIECLGAILAEQSNGESAATFLAGAETMKESIGVEFGPFEQRMHDHAVDLVRSQVGESRFDAAWAAGRALSQEDLILHALGIQD